MFVPMILLSMSAFIHRFVRAAGSAQIDVVKTYR